MRLQTKFNLAIIIVFAALAVGIAVITVNYVNVNTIREAENRVKIYAKAAWEIYDNKAERFRSLAEILAQQQVIRDLLQDPEDERALAAAMDYLETFRMQQGMDILNLMGPNGTVILRTRSPYNNGDSLTADPMVKQAILTRQTSAATIILELERLDVEGIGLVERCMAVGAEPRGMLLGAAVPILEGGDLLGVIQVGSLLNGATEKVDRIRDAVFENKYYNGKPVGTATIFMGDMRVSTNVMDSQGRRAVGTRVSKAVADQVLVNGLSWTGRAFVVDTWYLSQYDPIRDPDDRVIGILYVGELEQKYLDLRTRTVALYFSVILAGMILAFLLFFFIIRGVLRPIRMLSEATKRLSSGDLNHRVRAEGKDEIGDLSASFNYMAERLDRQRREIECRQKELETLSDELRTTNRNYMEMLGFVTHELKNPLASATMSLYTVKDGYLGELTPTQKKSLESVARSLDYFQDMIKNYLDLSRLEKGELAVNKSQIPLNTHVVEPILDGLDRGLQEKRMAVENRIPEDLTVNADGNLLRIIYDNLLSNAIKYGREGGMIVLDSRASDDRVTLNVQNEGQGIPPEERSRLFVKFSRLKSPEFVGQKGTGLGLYICKEIVEKHGGEIWVDSKMGEWVKFSFTLPN